MRISDWSSDVCSSDLPERRYPQGYAIHRRRRRPLQEERPPTEAEQNGDEIADIVQIPERLVEQPDLTWHVWIFFHHYGRSLDDIARRLGFSRRSSEEHTSEIQSRMRISYLVFCCTKKHHSLLIPHYSPSSTHTLHISN